jgi:hypothetical protein
MSDSAPAGWYDNPSGEGNLRYWNGVNWTDEFREKQAFQPAATPPPAAPSGGSASTAAISPVRSAQTTPQAGAKEIVAQGHNGTAVFDGDFVTIFRKGFRARMTVGKGDKRVPVHSITAVQWKPPGALVNGFISFTLGGGNERRSKFGSQTRSAIDDENSIVLMKKHVADFERLRYAVEQAIAERGRPQALVQAVDPVAQLKQLAELHQAGVLTDAEFEAKKASLMDRF